MQKKETVSNTLKNIVSIAFLMCAYTDFMVHISIALNNKIFSQFCFYLNWKNALWIFSTALLTTSIVKRASRLNDAVYDALCKRCSAIYRRRRRRTIDHPLVYRTRSANTSGIVKMPIADSRTRGIRNISPCSHAGDGLLKETKRAPEKSICLPDGEVAEPDP
jgi:hypothetical protein